MFLPPAFESESNLSSYFPTLEEQVLQEFQTSVVNCGNTSTGDSICTGSFTLEQVSNENNEIITHSYVFLLFLTLETAAEKTISTRGPFSSCSGAFDHVTSLCVFGSLFRLNEQCKAFYRLNSVINLKSNE